MPPLSLNPTAPAFKPPASTSGISETAAAIDFSLFGLDASLSPGLGIDPADPPSPVSVANEVAVALLGQSLLNALYEPFTPSLLTDGSDDNEDDELFDLLSITSTTPSMASSSMSVWSPAASSPSTAASCSAVKGAGYALLPALSHTERDEWRTALSSSNYFEDIWASDPDRGQTNVIYNTHNGAQNVFANPEVTDESDLDHKSPRDEQQQSSQWGRRYRAFEDPQKSLLVSNTAVSPSAEAQQFIISPSVPRTASSPSSPTRIPGLAAPLWPLLSALHRNLSRSRPDLYGAPLTPSYLDQGSLMPSDLSTQALGLPMTSWSSSSTFPYPSMGLI